MDELKQIIQEAWCAGDDLGKDSSDTFGAFLDRAVIAIREAGWKSPEEIKHDAFEDELAAAM